MRTAGKALSAAALSLSLVLAPPALAADAGRVGTCLLQRCRGELAACLADATCAESLVCLQTCNGRPDESDCQVQCGDQFNDAAVQKFNTCAVSEAECVPQRQDGDAVYPPPKPSAIARGFPLKLFQGDWWITAGQNKLFDIFDCQRHTFVVDPADTLTGTIRWRVADNVERSLGRPGAFFDNEVTQQFIQRSDNPALLENHDNDYLHYEDDWYIVDYELEGNDDDFVFVYYRGQNDAWSGYGGATVYTRTPTFPESIRKRVTAKAKLINFDFAKDFVVTDNSCPIQPPGRIQALESEVEKDVGLAKGNLRADRVLSPDLLRALARETASIEPPAAKLRIDRFLSADVVRKLSSFFSN